MQSRTTRNTAPDVTIYEEVAANGSFVPKPLAAGDPELRRPMRMPRRS
jgi:hypothetical protein